MNSLSPHNLFKKNLKDLAVQHAALAQSSGFQTTLAYAMAEMSMGEVTPEELRGGKIFLGILLNLAELPPPAPKPLPDKSLGQKPKDAK